MRQSPIVIYEPVRKTDPEEIAFWNFVFTPFLFAIVAGAMHWMWIEAAAVARHPFAAPLHTLTIGAIWLTVNGLMLWGLWRVLKVVWKIVCALGLFVSDLGWAISNRCGSLRYALAKAWRSRR